MVSMYNTGIYIGSMSIYVYLTFSCHAPLWLSWLSRKNWFSFLDINMHELYSFGWIHIWPTFLSFFCIMRIRTPVILIPIGSYIEAIKSGKPMITHIIMWCDQAKWVGTRWYWFVGIEPIIGFNFFCILLFWASPKWLYLWNRMLNFVWVFSVI